MKRREPAKPPRVPDPRDIWNDKVADRCATALAEWMRGSLNLSRPMRSLTRTEMKTMALTAIHTWIYEASHRVVEPISPDEHKTLKTLLG